MEVEGGEGTPREHQPKGGSALRLAGPVQPLSVSSERAREAETE